MNSSEMCEVVVLVIIANDFESGRTGSNPEWEQIYYKGSITKRGFPERPSLRGSALSIRSTELKGCNWGEGCKLIDDCSQELCLATPSKHHPE